MKTAIHARGHGGESPLLRHPLRHRIMEAIRATPGIVPQTLAARVGCNRSTVRYHLQRLHSANMVRIVAFNQRAHLFIASGMDAREQDALAVLQRGRTWDLVREVAQNPGQPQCNITQGLGLSRKLLRKYVNRLLHLGLIEEISEPPYIVYYPTQTLRTLVGKQAAQPPEAKAGQLEPMPIV